MKKRTVTAVVAACALCICLLAGCSSTSSSSSSSSSNTSNQQGTTLDFVLENATGFDLYSVEIKPADTADEDSWSSNLVPGDVLRNDAGIEVQHQTTNQVQLWDIRATGENDQLEFDDIELPNVSYITLTDEDGKPQAIFS